MSYCLIPKDRMYSFAEYIRSIQNINDLLNTNNMITNLNEASAEIDTQTGLLSEIVTSLQSLESNNKSLPEGYTLLKYIESSGTQYINTGFNPNQNTKILIDVEIPAQSSYPVALCGSRNEDTTSSASFVIFLMASGQFRTDFGTNNITTSEHTFPGRFTINKNKNATFINNSGYLSAETTFQSNYPIGLFTEIDIGGVDTRMATMKLYYCKIYDNDVLVRDFVPCINAEGEYGLYDFVNGQFYVNAGTGSFTGAS